jgi:hypothetical protein
VTWKNLFYGVVGVMVLVLLAFASGSDWIEILRRITIPPVTGV